MEFEQSEKLSPKFLAKFLESADANQALYYDAFIDLALYDEEVGYYQKKKVRVGSTSTSDFYTSVSIGPLFGKLLLEGICNVIPDNPSDYDLIEIGAEPNKSTFKLNEHPFKDYQILRLGKELKVSGKAVVFANEWLDAQAFRRLVFLGGEWKELGVRAEKGKLSECILPMRDLPVLPNASEGYRYDYPSGAIKSLNSLLKQNWDGLFITADYGLDSQSLLNFRPQGTARTYKNHNLGTKLLENPSDADITCHLNWDDLTLCLKESGFKNPQLKAQESFFMHHAKESIGAILTSQPGKFSQEKQALKQLIHPENMGSKFQILYANR